MALCDLARSGTPSHLACNSPSHHRQQKEEPFSFPSLEPSSILPYSSRSPSGRESMSTAPVPNPPRLLDLVRQAAAAHSGSPEPAERCVQWALRFILLHNKRHPRELGAADVVRFLQRRSTRVGPGFLAK